MLITTNALADKLIIEFDCYPKELQKLYLETGRKLDMNGNDRTEDSWGFIVNEGQRYIIYTYKPATEDDFNVIKDITFKHIGR